MIPTIYEHLGGAAALRRLAEAQYRHCLTDPALIPVFGTQGRPGHVERLAAELGGHGTLLRHHANLSITEAQRQRFVEVFVEAADEAGLPSDERFRRRFREYIEWGSRIAMEISQPGADVTTRQPVPRWDWE